MEKKKVKPTPQNKKAMTETPQDKQLRPEKDSRYRTK